jgi:hypothetical protein
MDLDEIKKNSQLIRKFCELDKYKKLKEEDNKKYEDTLMGIFKSFYEKYPAIFRAVIRGHDLDILYMMIEMKKKINSGEVDRKKAEIYMGEQLAERFLYPVIGKEGVDINKKKKDMENFLNRNE